jgi:pimeloyl-ACP methyl ester carboxylesterase
MEHTRLLLVPQICSLDWQIAPLLEEWAEVAVFDAPGVGDEPGVEDLGREDIARRGLEELDRLGWERCVVVADEFGVATALELARFRPEAVAGLAAGHACLSHDAEGDRPAINGDMMSALIRLADTDRRTWARHLTQATQGAYDDSLAERYIEQVPAETVTRLYREMQEGAPRMREAFDDLAERGVAMLLAEHRDCMLFTAEGYEDAVAAFPQARRASTPEKCSASPGFAEALHEFCNSLART